MQRNQTQPELSKKMRDYLRAIGSIGGKKSRRVITPEQQKTMQAGRNK